MTKRTTWHGIGRATATELEIRNELAQLTGLDTIGGVNPEAYAAALESVDWRAHLDAALDATPAQVRAALVRAAAACQAAIKTIDRGEGQ